jgi:cobalt-zinc-cadmium efflux system membrane fusion protein
MLATLVINSKLTRQLAVPTSAVVRENDRDHVFIKVTDTSFRLTAVELEEDAGAFRRVKKGLAEGNEIVVAGAFHLNNERKRAELE